MLSDSSAVPVVEDLVAESEKRRDFSRRKRFKWWAREVSNLRPLQCQERKNVVSSIIPWRLGLPDAVQHVQFAPVGQHFGQHPASGLFTTTRAPRAGLLCNR